MPRGLTSCLHVRRAASGAEGSPKLKYACAPPPEDKTKAGKRSRLADSWHDIGDEDDDENEDEVADELMG